MNNVRFRISMLASLVVSLATFLVAEDKPSETVKVMAKDIELVVPKAWKQEKLEGPAARFRVAQFAISPSEGDKSSAELVVTQFGGGGGGVEENLKRWNGQIAGKDRKIKVTKGKSKLGEYYVFDGSGTYNKPDGPPFAQKFIPVEGQRMVVVMLNVEDSGSYFLKLTGPEKTVGDAAIPLRISFGAKAEDEKPYPGE